MKLVIVPGNSPIHKNWAETLKKEMAGLFDEILILDYSHWGTDRPILDFDLELAKLAELARGKEEYVVVAKSAGTLLTMRAVHEGKLNPKACLFLGIPITWARNNSIFIEEWVRGFNNRTRIVQQDHDRTCSAEDLTQALQRYGVSNYILHVIPGEDHDYSDWNLLREELAALA